MSLTPEQIAAFADALAAARRAGTAIAVPTLALSAAADAYRIQDAVMSRVAPAAGWKVGAKSRDAVPTCAPLLAGTVLPLDGHATIAVGAAPIGVELEVAYRLGRAFAPHGDPPGDDEILSAIESAHVAVELCRARFVDVAKAPPLWLLADNQVNHLLIVGPAIAGWRDIDAIPPVARLAVNGEPVVESAAGHPASGTLRLLRWLVRHAIAERGGLAAGAVITTGSWTGLRWITPPALMQGELVGTGRIALQLA